MSGARKRRTNRFLRWGLALAAAVMLLACAPAALAAPETLQGAAYGHMKVFMQDYDKAGFAPVVDCGATKIYRAALAGVTLTVDPTLTSVAQYDPTTKTLTFSRDPRKVKGASAAAMGETVWHEVTHVLEDQHGDIGYFDSEAYAERNVDYMTFVARNALPWLEQLEKQAKKGVSAEKLKVIWEKYLSKMAEAAKLPSTAQYPPDLELMKTWFGFRANPEEVKALYLSGKAFSGKQWANLRKALTGPGPGLAIGDPYQGGTIAYILRSGDPGYVAGETHGLIAAVADQTSSDSYGIQWATEARWYAFAGSLGTAIGTGAANTDAIIAQNGAGGTYAAGLARAYTSGLFSGWYLPSKDELNKLYLNRVAIGGFDTTSYCYYWSSSEAGSSEADACYAWNQNFADGQLSRFLKGPMTAKVRAVRSF
jgi:hypothetical protein